jgi:hypothetical protein
MINNIKNMTAELNTITADEFSVFSKIIWMLYVISIFSPSGTILKETGNKRAALCIVLFFYFSLIFFCCIMYPQCCNTNLLQLIIISLNTLITSEYMKIKRVKLCILPLLVHEPITASSIILEQQQWQQV